jgi:hypothetical protein
MVPRTRVRSLSCALRAVLRAARNVDARSDSGDTGTATIFADGSVHLPLPFFAWLLEVPVLAEIRQDTGLFTFLLEPLQRPFEALVIVNDDFWHSLTHPSRPGKGRNPNKLDNLREP